MQCAKTFEVPNKGTVIGDVALKVIEPIRFVEVMQWLHKVVPVLERNRTIRRLAFLPPILRSFPRCYHPIGRTAMNQFLCQIKWLIDRNLMITYPLSAKNKNTCLYITYEKEWKQSYNIARQFFAMLLKTGSYDKLIPQHKSELSDLMSDIRDTDEEIDYLKHNKLGLYDYNEDGNFGDGGDSEEYPETLPLTQLNPQLDPHNL